MWGILKKGLSVVVTGEFIGSFVAGYLKGSKRQAAVLKEKYTFTNAQVTHSVDTINQLRDCAPIDQDLSSEARRQICNHIKKNNENAARAAAEKGLQPGGRKWCIDAIKTATTIICTCEPDAVREATFNLLGC